MEYTIEEWIQLREKQLVGLSIAEAKELYPELYIYNSEDISEYQREGSPAVWKSDWVHVLLDKDGIICSVHVG